MTNNNQSYQPHATARADIDEVLNRRQAYVQAKQDSFVWASVLAAGVAGLYMLLVLALGAALGTEYFPLTLTLTILSPVLAVAALPLSFHLLYRQIFEKRLETKNPLPQANAYLGVYSSLGVLRGNSALYSGIDLTKTNAHKKARILSNRVSIATAVMALAGYFGMFGVLQMVNANLFCWFLLVASIPLAACAVGVYLPREIFQEMFARYRVDRKPDMFA